MACVRTRARTRVCVCVSGIKLLSRHATNRDKVCFCRQVSIREWANCHGFLSLLSLDRAATVETYHPTKELSIFQFPFANPRKHAVAQGSEESIVQRPTGQVRRSFRDPPSWPSLSTGPWLSCIVTGHDQMHR